MGLSRQDRLPSPRGSEKACVVPISPSVRNLSTLVEARKSLLGVDPDASLPGVPEAAGESEEGATVTGAPSPEEEEVEEGRVPTTRKCPTSLNEE